MTSGTPVPRFTVSFTAVSADQCPLYEKDDRFTLKGLTLTVPAGKQTCLILADDILRHLVSGPDAIFGTKVAGRAFSCGGCEGRVAFSVGFDPVAAHDPEQMQRIEKLVRTLGHFSLFKTLDEKVLKDILPDLKMLRCEPGRVIIRQGQAGEHLYIILDGSVKVVESEKNILLAKLGPGDVFGEMSLLSDGACTATVETEKDCRILSLDGNLFREMVKQHPSMQRYIFQLLSHRLRTTNLLKESQLAEGVQGNLTDLSLPEFLQAMNISHKSGVVKLALPRGDGEIEMNNGQVMSASYVGRTGCEAFYGMLVETQGTFAYEPTLSVEAQTGVPLGEFMNLLMEGLVRMDEEQMGSENRLRALL